ncbi:MAG: PepSY domain-containing protein [Pyrinomonadaceae bacterium]
MRRATQSRNPQQQRKQRRNRTGSVNRRAKKKDVTQEKAQQIALKRARGTVESSELKTEKGREVYEFAIKNSKGQIRDIWIDQKTGKVVHDSVEKHK